MVNQNSDSQRFHESLSGGGSPSLPSHAFSAVPELLDRSISTTPLMTECGRVEFFSFLQGYNLSNDPQISKTIELVENAFQGLTRKNGKTPIFTGHLLPMALNLAVYKFDQIGSTLSDVKDAVLLALCHDLLEDTKVTYGQIVEASDQLTAERVRLMSAKSSQNYPGHNELAKKMARDEDYYRQVQSNPLCVAAKAFDVLHCWHTIGQIPSDRNRFLIAAEIYLSVQLEFGPYAVLERTLGTSSADKVIREIGTFLENPQYRRYFNLFD